MITISSAEAETIAEALRYQANDMRSHIWTRYEHARIMDLLALANRIDERAKQAALLWPAQPTGEPAE